MERRLLINPDEYSVFKPTLKQGFRPIVRKTLGTKEFMRGIGTRFEEATKLKSMSTGDVEAGRRYVRAYVAYIHYIERLREALATESDGHYRETKHADERSANEREAAESALDAHEEGHTVGTNEVHHTGGGVSRETTQRD